jgi:hypothetical protein
MAGHNDGMGGSADEFSGDFHIHYPASGIAIKAHCLPRPI